MCIRMFVQMAGSVYVLDKDRGQCDVYYEKY